MIVQKREGGYICSRELKHKVYFFLVFRFLPFDIMRSFTFFLFVITFLPFYEILDLLVKGKRLGDFLLHFLPFHDIEGV